MKIELGLQATGSAKTKPRRSGVVSCALLLGAMAAH